MVDNGKVLQLIEFARTAPDIFSCAFSYSGSATAVMGFAASAPMSYSAEAVPSSNATYSNPLSAVSPKDCALIKPGRSAVAADESWAPCSRIADADVHAARNTRACDRRAPIYVRGGSGDADIAGDASTHRGVRVGAAGAIRCLCAQLVARKISYVSISYSVFVQLLGSAFSSQKPANLSIVGDALCTLRHPRARNEASIASPVDTIASDESGLMKALVSPNVHIIKYEYNQCVMWCQHTWIA